MGASKAVATSKDYPSEHARFTGRQKTDAVLRVLGGVAVGQVSSELGISIRRLERWRVDFVSAGSAELGKRTDIPKHDWFKIKDSVQQWTILLLLLIAIIIALTYRSQ